MRKVIFILVLISKVGLSQEVIRTFEIGGPHPYKDELTIDLNPDHAPKINVWFGFNVGAEKNSYVGGSFYLPKLHLANFHAGNGVGYDGIIFIKNWTKVKEITTPFKISKMITYKMRNGANKRKSLGVNYGISRYGIIESSRKASNAFIGMSILSVYGSSIKFKTNSNKTLKGYNRFIISSKVMKYFNHSNYSFDQIEDINEFGFKMNIEGYFSTWSKLGIIGLNYSFGFGSPSFSGNIWLDIGLGLNLSFL